MFLRNKLAILSITLMSFMTIPTLAENDTSPVTSRIENTKFDVQVKTPEGWSPTKEFDAAIPDSFEFGDHVFRGLKFKNGTENHGCAIFFGTDTFFDDIEEVFIQTQELAFPELKQSSFNISKLQVNGSLSADFKSENAQIDVVGFVEGDLERESGDISKLTITGGIKADTTTGDFAIGTGSLVSEGTVPFCGTTAVFMNDDYNIVIVMWGSDKESQVTDTQRFLQALTVTPKASEEADIEIVSDAVVISELTGEKN